MALWQFVALLLAITLIILPYILSRFLDIKDVVPIVISLLALFFSLVATFKERIFPPKLEILYGDLIISPADKYSKDDLILVLPITFVNTGFNEVFVYNFALKIIYEESSEIMLYTPLFEIDINKLITGKRRLNIDNMDTPFTSFALSTSQTKKKHIMFSQVLNDKNYPHKIWKPGKYRFELFARTRMDDKYEKLGQFVWKIDKKLIEAFNEGNSTYLVNPPNFEADN